MKPKSMFQMQSSPIWSIRVPSYVFCMILLKLHDPHKNCICYKCEKYSFFCYKYDFHDCQTPKSWLCNIFLGGVDVLRYPGTWNNHQDFINGMKIVENIKMTLLNVEWHLYKSLIT